MSNEGRETQNLEFELLLGNQVSSVEEGNPDSFMRIDHFLSYFFLFLPNTLKCAIISLFFKARTCFFTFQYGKWEVICHIILPASTTHTHTHMNTYTLTLTLSFLLLNGILSMLLVISCVVFILLSFTYFTYMNNSCISIVESRA